MRKKSFDSVRVYYPKHSKEELIALLKERVSDLSKRLPIKLAILFGSYAAGRHTVASDIDLFIVVQDLDKNGLYHMIYDGLNLGNLQLHLYTLEEYNKLKGSSFVKEVEEKGVIIFGG
jgi:hypothetical protein